MIQKRIAEVVVNHPSRNVDKTFHYKVPEALVEKVGLGIRVLVPFGLGDKKTEAYIIGLIEQSDMQNLKHIYDVVDDTPLFYEKMIPLVHWMRERYLCTYYEAIKAIIPPGIGLKLQEWITLTDEMDIKDIQKAVSNSPVQQEIIRILREYGNTIELTDLSTILGNHNIRRSVTALCKKKVITLSQKSLVAVKDKTVRVATLAVSREEAIEYLEQMQQKAPVQARMLEVLLDNEFVQTSDLVMFSQGSYNTLNTLYKKGLIEYEQRVVVRDISAVENYQRTTPYNPTPEQERVLKLVLQHIEKALPATIMLRGVTGSGKTEIFLQVISQVIAMGKQAIVLVPEISLTPQMVERFVGRFGSRVAVLHSGLSMGERYDQWKKIRNEEVDVVVGARSAIFAPFRNLGMIILDEEHENTYKSETSPRYHAKEVAIRRSINENTIVLLSSATPSIESYHKAVEGCYELVHMTKRFNNVPLPEVRIVDMRKELADGNKSIFSHDLVSAIENNLRTKQQTILFLNRRGYSTFVSCRSCGYVLKCPYCNISLTYHMQQNILTCHYCGYRRKNVMMCPSCNSKYIRYFGVGTQKVEQQVKQLFPEASVARMDVDTTGRKFAHEKILNAFRDGHIDILIGTQMVSKGLDFPNVTLIGVLAADMSLNIDDFRSAERTFQLITQVSGRAGRGDIEGRAIIQTYQPYNFTIQLAKHHDYIRFYENEIQLRKQLNYPPFCQIVCIFLSGVDEVKVKQRIHGIVFEFKKKINDSACDNLWYNILGPIPAPIPKIKSKYRWRVLVKCNDCNEVRSVLMELLNEHYRHKQYAAMNLTIDINPVNMF